MSRLMDRKAWSGPVGIARIICLVSATVIIVWSFAFLTTFSPANISVLMTIMVAAMAFVVGHQVGQSKRPQRLQ